jgi:energy-coupling factor transporter transmembrane protein EcfT
MLSRGYNGEVRLLHAGKVKLRDWVWLSCVATLFIVMLYFNLSGKI